MKFIIEDKIYDTEKAEEIFKYRQKCWKECKYPFFGENFNFSEWKSVTLYRTSKGKWFIVRKNKYDKEIEGIVQTDEEVKKTFSQLNKIDLYNRYFSKLEEA